MDNDDSMISSPLAAQTQRGAYAALGAVGPNNAIVFEKLQLDKFKKDRKHKKAPAVRDGLQCF